MEEDNNNVNSNPLRGIIYIIKQIDNVVYNRQKSDGI